jgi:hypothetical protein
MITEPKVEDRAEQPYVALKEKVMLIVTTEGVAQQRLCCCSCSMPRSGWSCIWR